MLARRREGVVRIKYVVDTTGAPDPMTAQVLEATHPAFGESVIAALPGMRFTPARIGDRPVPQLVTQSFTFRMERRYAKVRGPR